MNETANDNIIRLVRNSLSRGLTALEMEEQLEGVLGPRVHQTVTGNLRHLVEDGVVVQIPERQYKDSMRQVYVMPEYYSAAIHGGQVVIEHKPRQPVTDEERAALRERVESAKPDSALARVRQSVVKSSEGVTCREIEQELGIRHQTVSARLSELTKAGSIRKVGKRVLQGERSKQSVYKPAT